MSDGEWFPNMEMGPIRRSFFKDENILAHSEEATYEDWAPGPNENPERVKRKRPPGDMSFINWKDEEVE